MTSGCLGYICTLLIPLLILRSFCSKDQDSVASGASKTSTKTSKPDKHAAAATQSSSVTSNDDEDFDPRGMSSASKYSLLLLFLEHSERLTFGPDSGIQKRKENQLYLVHTRIDYIYVNTTEIFESCYRRIHTIC